MIDLRAVTKTFQIGNRTLTAVNNVSLQIHPKEIVGLVGESGSGKSTLGKMLVQLERPSQGEIFFEGKELSLFHKRTFCRQVQMIFQDPFASLNPRMTVGDLIREPLRVHRLPEGQIVEHLLDLVGLPNNAKSRFPHEFSSGQKQRIGIARALSLNPKFIVCDEPISALDVSIQAQIASLLQNLQQELNLTYLLIAHDLAMVHYLSTRVVVMYLGSFVEIASTDSLFANPLHPYTQLLIASVHLPNPILERKKARILVSGDPPSPLSPPPGCAFSNRCPKAMPICHSEAPQLIQIGENHQVACHLYPFQLKGTQENEIKNR